MFFDENALEGQASFAAAVRAIQPALRRYAWRLARNEADRDDLVQDTLTRAWRARRQFMPGSNFKAWLFRIARNCFLSGLRRSVRFAPWDADVHDRLLVSAPAQDEALYVQDLEQALATLPEQQREALLLVTREGLSYEDAARFLDVKIGTLKSRVARARPAVMTYLSDAKPSAARDGASVTRLPMECTDNGSGKRYREWKARGSNMIGEQDVSSGPCA